MRKTREKFFRESIKVTALQKTFDLNFNLENVRGDFTRICAG